MNRISYARLAKRQRKEIDDRRAKRGRVREA